MPTVDELLNNTIESQACTIDPDTRVINVPACYKEFGVEADEKVNRIKFQCPKIVGDNIDLTTFNLYINYMNARGNYNVYLVDDVTVSGDNITFSWLLSRHVTEKSGTVNYIVCAKKSDDTSVINEWNTKVATATVGVGLEATAVVEEQNADVIEQILKKINAIGSIETGTNISLNVTGAAVGQIVQIATVDNNGVPTAWSPVDMPSGADIGADQISAAVSSWLTEHPDATTTVQDGAVTGAKLSDDLYKQVMGDARHNLTEVEVTPIPESQAGSAWAAANFDGTEYNVVTTYHTPFTATPRYIKVVNKTSDTTISLRSGYDRFRFANGTDEAADGFAVTDGSRNLQFFHDLSVAPGDTLLYDLQEYGRKGCEYFQFIVTGKNIGGKYTDTQFVEKLRESVEIYYVYDSYVPTYELPDDTGEFLTDLPVKYVAQGVSGTSATRVYAVAPYYPDTTYNVRGGYYPTINDTALSVVYLYDDTIFNGRDAGIEFNSGTCGAIPLIKGMSTTQYDTSVNAGRNNAYAWAYHKTPPASELVGPKYIGICFLDFDQDENIDMGAEYYNSVFDTWNAEGAKNRYITRFNKQVPRSLYAQLAFQNPNYHDDGSKYYAMLSAASRSPLVGASWVLFGDSLTDNYGGHDLTGNYFATKIAREFNMSIDNRAKSGSNIYRGGSGNYTSVSGMVKLDEFVSEIEAETTVQPDYITIAFGTNSFTAQLGTNEDTSETDTSVYGATKRFIEVLRETCPKSVFGFVLSPKQNWGSSDPNNLRAVDSARNAIKTVCEEYAVPYIDMSTQSGITAAMLPDGIHISNDQSQNLYYHAMRRFMIGL